MMRTTCATAPIVLPLLLLASCGGDPIKKPNNMTTHEAVDALAANIAEHDGRTVQPVPLDPQTLGEEMRRAPAKPPGP